MSGMGKTTLPYLLIRLFGLHYSRIQFISDMFPADIIGISIFLKNTSEFHFHRDPAFSQVVLAERIYTGQLSYVHCYGLYGTGEFKP